MKILVVTKNWVGDILFEFPTIEAIKKRYPESEIACIAPARCREILENHPDIDRVILFDERNEHRSLWARFKFILELRKGRWDQAYILHRSRTRASMLYFGGVKERIGFGGARKLFLSKVVPEPEPIFHQVDHFLKMLDGVGIEYPSKPAYQFYYTPENEKNALDLLKDHEVKRYCCFHLGANWIPKRWPPEHFGKLADQLHEKWGLEIVITGASRDMPLFKKVEKSSKSARIHCFVGKTGLGDLGAIFRRACFLVSGDSGPLHLASGVGTPVVALFGPTDPELTGPRGIGESEVIRFVPKGFSAPWYGKNLPKEGWLSHIMPAQVIEVLEHRGWATRLPEVAETGEVASSTVAAPEAKKKINKILLFTLSNIGDAILTTPVLMSLRHEYPNGEVTVVCSPRASGLFERSQHVHELVEYDKKACLKEKINFVKKLRSERFDLVIDLRNSFLPYLLKARKRSPSIRRFKSTLMRDKHLEVLKMSKLKAHYHQRFDFFKDQDAETFKEVLRSKGVIATQDWILIAPAAASELKTWRIDGFREVIEHLLETRPEDILLVGDKREHAIAEPLTQINPNRVHNIAGETTLKELAYAVSKCQLLVANDSAVMHLGFEFLKPVVALFGPTDPKKYGRSGSLFRMVREEIPCSPCEQPRCKLERQVCFEDLTAKKVIQACEELLGDNVFAH